MDKKDLYDLAMDYAYKYAEQYYSLTYNAKECDRKLEALQNACKDNAQFEALKKWAVVYGRSYGKQCLAHQMIVSIFFDDKDI